MATEADSLTGRDENDDAVAMAAEDVAIDDDLEEYGVWVKVGPEDVDADPVSGNIDPTEASDVEVADEALLTEEEEQLLGDLEDSQQETEQESGSEQLGPELSDISLDELPNDELEDLSMANIEDELEMEDLGDLNLDDDDLASALDDEGAETAAGEDVGALDLPISDDDSGGGDAASLHDLEELTLEDEGEPLRADSGPDELSTLPDVDLDEELHDIEDLSTLDTDVVEPVDEIAPPGAEDPELEELGNLTGDDEVVSIELGDSESLPGAEEDLDSIDLDELKQSDFGEELAELELEDDVSDELEGVTLDDEPEEIDVAVTESLAPLAGAPSEREIDDLAELEDDLSTLDEIEATHSDEPDMTFGDTGAAHPESVEVLHNIEQELHAIKEELSALKSELSSLRAGGTSEETVEEAPSAPSTSLGFFDEDDDETIALTGDELDNILSTADITEETEQESETLDDVDEIDLAAPPSEDSDLNDLEIEPLDTDEEELLAPESSSVESMDSDFAEQSLEDAETGELHEALVDRPDIVSMDEPEDAASIVDEVEEESGVDVDLADVPLGLALEDDENDIGLETLRDEELSEAEDDEIVLEPLGDAESDDEPDIEELELDIDPEQEEATDEQDVPAADTGEARTEIPDDIRTELKTVLSYLDQLLESLPEDKIQEFAQSEHFDVYKRLFEELGLAT